MAVKGNGGSISVINPSGASLVVTITRGTTTPVAYTTEALSATHTMPLTITDDETFWFADAGEYTVSVTQNDAEIANGVGGTKTIQLVGGCGVGFTPSPEFDASSAELGIFARALDFQTGWGPGFGCEGTDPAGEGVLPFTDAYQLDSTPAGTSSGGESVDDEWFSWDSEGVGDELGRVYIKRPGFYWVSMFVSLSAPATDPWELKFQSGNTTFHRHVPGGFGAAGFFDSAVVPLGGVPYVYLQFDPGDNVGLEIATCALIFVPLFDSAA